MFVAGGSNTGSLAGAVIGAMLGVLAAVMAVTVVLVVTFLLWRKNQKYSFTNNDRAIANPTYSYEGDVYAMTGI